MLQIIAILMGKIFLIAGNLINKGSSFPGSIALKIDKNLLAKFSLPKIVIAVTGSSGKGSTSSMIAKVYKDLGYKVAHNHQGSNMKYGITSLLIEHSNLKGKIKSDVLIYEIDERSAQYIFDTIKPKYVIITNITRDQPPRQGHIDLIYNEIKKTLNKDMHLILNADDPYLTKLNLDNKFKTTYYSINDNKYTYKKSKFNSLNMSYCPLCHTKLNYNFYHFECIGDFYCPKCNFKKQLSNYTVTKLNYDKFEITINNKHKLHIPQNILFCVYNTLAAFTLLSILKIKPDDICKSLSKMSNDKNIYNTYTYNNRLVYVLNNKNENATTFNQSLLFINRYKEEKIIIIGWKEISRRYAFDDLSWLYDIDFEILKNNNVTKFICVGIHSKDLATRLKYAGYREKDIIIKDNLEEACTILKTKTKGNIYAVLNFDYVNPFNKYMAGSDKNEN